MLMVGLCSHNLRKSSCCAEATGTVGTAGAFTNEEACHLVFGGKLFVQGGSGKTCKDERRPLLGDISLGAVAGRQQPRRPKGYHKLSVKYLYIGYQPGFIAPLRPESVHIIRHLLRMQWKWLPRVILRYSSWTKMGVCTVCDGIYTSTWWKGINLCLFLVIWLHSKYKSFLFTLRVESLICWFCSDGLFLVGERKIWDIRKKRFSLVVFPICFILNTYHSIRRRGQFSGRGLLGRHRWLRVVLSRSLKATQKENTRLLNFCAAYYETK